MRKKYILEKSKDNYDILKIDSSNKTIYIGSKYNENREINKVCELAKPISENDNYIILGLGRGTHIDELKKIKNSKSQILIIECETDWIKKFEDINKDKKNNKDIHIAKSIKGIKIFFETYINEQNISGLKIIPYSNYNKLYKEEIVYFYKKISKYSTNLISNRNTHLVFAKTWFESIMENIKYISKSEFVADYKKKYEAKPAIIVSAGPSLSKNIEELRTCSGAVIISGGRTLKSLLNIGVEPHYTVIVDPKEESYNLVNGYIDKLKNTFVYHLGAPSKALKQHSGPKVLFSDDKYTDDIIGKTNCSISSGGSVAHSMTSFAMLMGCNPIIFIGQDFAYTNDKGHASVAASPWESIELENYKNKDDFDVKDVYGEMVRTSPTLNLYRLQMENIIEGHKDTAFINATEGGAHINGTAVMELKEVLSKYKNPVEYENKPVKIDKIINDKLLDKLEKCYLALNELFELYNIGLSILGRYEKLIKCGAKNIHKIECEMNEVETKVLKLNKKMIFMDSLIYPVVDSVNNLPHITINSGDSSKEAREKNIKKSILIYQEMKNVIEYARPIILKTIEDLRDKEI